MKGERSALPVAAGDRLAIGSAVVVVGVKSQPSLNGKRGVVEGYDEAKGRYTVGIEGEDHKKNLRPANLTAAADWQGACRRLHEGNRRVPPSYHLTRSRVVPHEGGRAALAARRPLAQSCRF